MSKEGITAFNKLYGNLWYTHKTHEKEAWILFVKINTMRWINVVLISIVLLLQFVQLLKPELVWVKYVSIGLIVAEIGFAIFQLSFAYDRLLDKHRAVAKNLVELKNDFISTSSKKNFSGNIDRLSKATSLSFRDAPQTSLMAEKLADRAWKKEYNDLINR